MLTKSDKPRSCFFIVGLFSICLLLLSCTNESINANTPDIEIQPSIVSSPAKTFLPPGDLNPTDAYIFPIRPGMPEWKAFTSHNQMVNACWIPEDTLNNMSTAGLVDTVVNYPLGGDFGSSECYQEGVDRVSRQFNGLAELLRRQGAEMALLAKYRNMDPITIDKHWSDFQRAEHKFTIFNTELIIAQNSLLFQLDQAELRYLISEVLAKYRIKQQGENAWNAAMLDPNVWILARALQQANYPPFLALANNDIFIKKFVKDGYGLSDGMRQKEIASLSEQYLSGK